VFRTVFLSYALDSEAGRANIDETEVVAKRAVDVPR